MKKNIIWEVRVCDDDECRKMRSLGWYRGKIEDIAFYLQKDGSSCSYPLYFKEVTINIKTIDKKELEMIDVSVKSVCVSIDEKVSQDIKEIATGNFYDYKYTGVSYGDYRFEFFTELHKEVGEKELRNQREKDEAKKMALSKLTDDEKRLLGIS